MNKTRLLISYKITFGLLAFSSVVAEIVTLYNRNQLEVGNLFSYFTIQSNLFAVFVLLLGALALASRTKAVYVDYLRGAGTLFMVTTGIVFAVLLSGYDPRVLTALPWDNFVLHQLIPVILAIDWLIDPPKTILQFKKSLYWLLYPLAYVIYSLIRGPIVNWYPYPFLDPSKNGPVGVLVVSIGIAVFVALMAYAVVWVGNKRIVRSA